MSQRHYRVVILAVALLIIGNRALCAAQFSQRPAVRKSDTQEWNDVQLAIPLSKSADLLVLGTLRFGQNVTSPAEERIGGGFNCRIKKYVYLTPTYEYVRTQPGGRRKGNEHRLSFAATFRLPFEKFTVSDRNLIERRIRDPQLDSFRYRNRFQIERPLKLGGLRVLGYISDEVFYESSVKRWVRNQFAAGVSRRFSKHFVQAFYYARQNDAFTRPGDLNVIGTVLRIRL